MVYYIYNRNEDRNDDNYSPIIPNQCGSPYGPWRKNCSSVAWPTFCNHSEASCTGKLQKLKWGDQKPSRSSETCRKSTGWKYTYPSEKYEFVNRDDEIPKIWKKKSHVPNHQPVKYVRTKHKFPASIFHLPIHQTPCSWDQAKLHTQPLLMWKTWRGNDLSCGDAIPVIVIGPLCPLVFQKPSGAWVRWRCDLQSPSPQYIPSGPESKFLREKGKKQVIPTCQAHRKTICMLSLSNLHPGQESKW